MADLAQVRSRAGEFADDPALLGDPIGIRDASGELAAWFVPQVSGNRLLGFVELMPDLAHRRTSRFGTPQDARAWLDPAAVRERAAEALAPGEAAGDPYLSFDGALDRRAWAVPVDGTSDVVFVAGEAVWRGRRGEDAVGGPG
ncbi:MULTISPECIES: hypothetical protein [Microbacterium]|uniref:hypothetical protein n=1 Tax=Microbacterium TaxID=33882 RepID=UPI00146B4FF6|nr:MULTISPECIES: hypothetical protein [Microbacterium]